MNMDMSVTPKKIELLAPARDLKTAIDAINHGADAVYIGAPRFGARQAAGNSVEDIGLLTDYAHLFGVKVYVALNTILYDDELHEAERLIKELYDVGVDALIVQDMGITAMDIPPIPLHASTQMDNRTVSKVDFLYKAGFKQIVLARELSLNEIAGIHSVVPDARLEVFIHGALCVSYSGRCFASQHCFGRSANRGACAQFCRLSFDLEDAEGRVVVKDKHLLSLKDMNRSDVLEQMLDAGVVSLKIEGRLKDSSYVKNVTAYYRKCLDDIFMRRPEYVRASYGKSFPQFVPVLEKSFNRGFTRYFFYGRGEEITSFDTPKSLGEKIDRVIGVSGNRIVVSNGKSFSNGDGVCFIDRLGKLQGFRINRVDGNVLFLQTAIGVHVGAQLYRNFDAAFEREVLHSSVTRRLSANVVFEAIANGFRLTVSDETGVSAYTDAECNKSVALKPQRENLVLQLRKWGNTPFEIVNVRIAFDEDYFIPSSLVADMRRKVCELLKERHKQCFVREVQQKVSDDIRFPETELDYSGNVSNVYAEKFYKDHGVSRIEPAFELEPRTGVPVMYCKHCIKYSFGWCSKSGKKHSYKEPFYIVCGDGNRFRLLFDCKNCVMCVMNVRD